MSQHFSIDSIAMREDRVFGWGWFLDTEQTILRSELRIPLVDGTEAVLACIPGGMREDLGHAFPDVSHAASAGFMLRGHLHAHPVEGEDAQFVVWLADGTHHAIPLKDFPRAFLPVKLSAAGVVLVPLWERFWQIWRDRGWRGVGGSVRSRAREVLTGVRMRFTAWRMQVRLRRCVVVFDHSMGGGANRYRDELVGGELAAGNPVAVVTPQLSSLQYRLHAHFADGSNAHIVCDRAADLLHVLERARPIALHVNDLVSFDDPFSILAWCKGRHAGGAHLGFYLHDFHAVCPAFTLIDREGRYCGVPSLDACRRCLPDNATHTLGFHQNVDILDWRGPWHRFLATCDQIVVFSEASAQILRKAHPDLEPTKILLRPHRSTAPTLRAVQPRLAEPLIVAVVGHISVAKGALVIAEMAQIARAQGLPVRFVVIGTLDQHPGSDTYLEVLGSYRAADLPDLLEQHGAGLCLLPSICPETYSYVTDEIMQTGMPLAVFDIGAPAERVALYARGLVITDTDAGPALAAIMAFSQSLSGGHRTSHAPDGVAS